VVNDVKFLSIGGHLAIVMNSIFSLNIALAYLSPFLTTFVRYPS